MLNAKKIDDEINSNLWGVYEGSDEVARIFMPIDATADNAIEALSSLGVMPEIAPTEDDYRRAIQRHVDETAQARNYDGGNSLASYKDSTIPQWSSEAVALIAWRDQVWFYAYAELAKVMAGEREQPSVEEFIAELPVIAWPETEEVS